MKSIALAVLSLLLPVAARAAQKPPLKAHAAQTAVSKPAIARNFRISFKLKDGVLESSGNFVLMNATQSNYVTGGDIPYETPAETGRGVEYKKVGTIVNCLPAQNPEKPEEVGLQCQFELSGPGKPGVLGAVPIQTFQYQAEFALTKGRELALVDEPERKVSVRVDDVAP